MPVPRTATGRAPSARPTWSGRATGPATCCSTWGRALSRTSRARCHRSACSPRSISHLHPDHFVDLVSFRHYLHWQLKPPGRARVIGPAGLGDRLDALHAEPGFSAAALDIEVLRPGRMTFGPFEVEAAKVRHTDDSYAFRVSTDGMGLVYSGDCGHAEDLEPLIRPGDMLLTEVSFGPGPVPPGAGHLDGPAVGALAARTGVGGVLLTHLQMGFDPAETIASVEASFGGAVTLVAPGERIAIASATF